MRILEETRPGATPTHALTRTSLLAARRSGGHEWLAQTDTGAVRLKPFPDIAAEHYSLYQEVLRS
jgi:hypothetical protein